MAGGRVKPENRKNASGRRATVDIDPFLKMGEDLIIWSKDPTPGTYFKDFVLDYEYTKGQIEHALSVSEEFRSLYARARAQFARSYRQKSHESNNGMYARFMPLIDAEYKEWRREELKLEAQANIDNVSIMMLMQNKSGSIIKEEPH